MEDMMQTALEQIRQAEQQADDLRREAAVASRRRLAEAEAAARARVRDAEEQGASLRRTARQEAEQEAATLLEDARRTAEAEATRACDAAAGRMQIAHDLIMQEIQA